MGDRDPMVTPAEGDVFACPAGEVRVDLVRAGWVYFVQWAGDAETGAPTRMPAATFTEALRKHQMTPKEKS